MPEIKFRAYLIPSPGSDKAIDMGCTCPVLDNSHGKGYLGQPNVFVCNCGCPVHKKGEQ